MADNLPAVTAANVQSVSRHIISYTGGFVTALVGVAGIATQLHIGGITPDQVVSIKTAGEALVSGVTSVAGALGTLATVGAGIWAWFASRPPAQAASIINSVPGTQIVAPPALAEKVEAVHSTNDAVVKVVG